MKLVINTGINAIKKSSKKFEISNINLSNVSASFRMLFFHILIYFFLKRGIFVISKMLGDVRVPSAPLAPTPMCNNQSSSHKPYSYVSESYDLTYAEN